MATRPATVIYCDERQRGGQVMAESRLVKEWLQLRYPGATVYGRIRLGPTARRVTGIQLTPEQERMLSVENWYPDALILSPDECVILEAKINPKPAAIGEVLFYRTLIYRTAELSDLLALTFQPVVLFAEADETLNQFAATLGVRVEIYSPAWLPGYLLTRQFRNRRPANEADSA